MNCSQVQKLYNNIAQLIDGGKTAVAKAVNESMISMYWNIGKTLCDDILLGERAQYGETIVLEISKRLTANFGKGFNKTALFRMLKFYQEFQNYEIVATLSQQLTWSHLVEAYKSSLPLAGLQVIPSNEQKLIKIEFLFKR